MNSSMLKSVLGVVFVLSLITNQLIAQQLEEISRESNLEYLIKRKDKKALTFQLDSLDEVSLTVSSNRLVNISLKDANDQVIYEKSVHSDPISWQGVVETTGPFTIAIDNTNYLLQAKIDLTLTVVRKPFQYGSDVLVDSLKILGSDEELLKAELQMIRAIPKIYPVPVSKGDTLAISIDSFAQKFPFIELKNDKEEILWASIPQKEQQITTSIPVLDDGVFTLSMNSNSFLKKKNVLTINKKTPIKYLFPETQEDSVVVVEEVVAYDTIPEVFMDTVIFIGGIRDFVHEREQRVSFQFTDTSNIVFWGVLFGEGDVFLDGVTTFESLLKDDILASGATDILSAYGLGYLAVLPKSDLKQITFYTSDSIAEKLSDPLLQKVKANYAIFSKIEGYHFLNFKNDSESYGKNIFIKIITFRRMEK